MLFFLKNKITLLNDKWEIIETYYSRFKPSISEFIFSKKNNCYFRVKQVIHSLKSNNGLILLVEKNEINKKVK